MEAGRVTKKINERDGKRSDSVEGIVPCLYLCLLQEFRLQHHHTTVDTTFHFSRIICKADIFYFHSTFEY